MERQQGPPAVLLDALVSGIRGVLGDDLVGLYLYGSSVSGGFDPGVSDVDLVAVTSAEVEAINLPDLERMHQRLVAGYPDWEDRIEVVYVSRTTLGSFRTSAGALAVISPGEPFHLRDDPPSAWLQNWYLVRETGVTLFGPDPAAIVPPIAWTEFVATTVRYAEELRNRSHLDTAPGPLAYAILTLCRALRTVRLGAIATKQEGAAWVRGRMPEWTWLVDAALECRRSRGTVGLADERSRSAAETFIPLIADDISGHEQGSIVPGGRGQSGK